MQGAREDRDYQESLLRARHDFATRDGAMRSTLTHGSVRGDATEGLPAIDEGLSGIPQSSSEPSPNERSGAEGGATSTDHLNHEKLSRLIPGYVKPDENKAKD